MSKIQWDSQLYLRYGRERTQPSIDLASRIDLDSPAAIIDLGCGPGNSTRVLREREMAIWPILIDNAPMPHAEELPQSIREISYRNALVIDSGIDFEVHVARLIRALKGFLSHAIDAVISSAQYIPPGTATEAAAAHRLKELFEALTDCHTAYLRYAADLENLPRAHRREELRKRPEYLESVRRLIDIIWRQRPALQIYAPDAYEALVSYADSEADFGSPEGVITNRLLPTLAGKDGFRFEDARNALATFIRNNARLHELL